MDIISHGLWGGVAFGRKSRRDYLTAFFFGVVPDLFSFGIYTLASLFRIIEPAAVQRAGQHDMSLIPSFVGVLYNYTHSLVIFTLIFAFVWFVRKRPYWLMAGWGLHILVDIPSHDETFFPTPFLWPISNFKADGISWGDPVIFFPNLALLFIAYATWYFIWKRRKLKKKK